jgi:hypothetical protein
MAKRETLESRDRHSLNSKEDILYNKGLKEDRKYIGLIAGFPNRKQEARQVNQIRAKINVFTGGEKVLCAVPTDAEPREKTVTKLC